MISKKVKVELVLIMTFIGIMTPCMAFAYPWWPPDPPPPPSIYYPSSVTEHPGDHYSGNLESLKYNDGNEYIVKADWWWFIVYIFEADITIDFPNQIANLLKIELRDNADRNNFGGSIIYTSGSDQSLIPGAGDWDNGWLSDGQYTFTLDPSRAVDKVEIWFRHYSLVGGDKYAKIDYAYLLKI